MLDAVSRRVWLVGQAYHVARKAMREHAPGSPVARATRVVIIGMIVQRAGYLVNTVAVLATRESGSYTLHHVLLLALVTVWSVALFSNAWLRGRFTATLIYVDVAIAVAVLLLVTSLVFPAPSAHTSPMAPENWGYKLDFAAASLVGAGLTVPMAILAVTVLAVVDVVAVLFPYVPKTPGVPAQLITHISSLVAFTVVAGAIFRYIRNHATRLDEANARMIAAESRRAADLARYEERAAQHRALHDNVLTTLVALARGGLDYTREEVRARCARDAGYLRRLLQSDRPQRGVLAEALEETVRDAEALGLRVHFVLDPLPGRLDGLVVTALADAAGEALNNVVRHSGQGQAWLTATYQDETVTVRVVDRGRGFDPGVVRWGLGVPRSIRDRMHEVGGDARVDSAPGEGTCVELSWHP